jgi:hypothetical protein
MRGLDLLECDHPGELLIARQVHLAETAPGMTPHDAVPRTQGDGGIRGASAGRDGARARLLRRFRPVCWKSPDPVGRGGCGLEGLANLQGAIRESLPKLVRVRGLAGQAAVGQLQAQEISQERRPGGFREVAKDVFDTRSPARPPGGLELVAGGIYLPR